MKEITPYRPFDHFVFRSPLFSFDHLKKGEDAMKNNAFAEALFIASPDLSEASENKEKTRHSAYRYFQRACTRSTPFGLFAGCSVGTVGERTEIRLLEEQKYRRNTRLDMNYTCALTQQIEKKRNIREQLYYSPNSSIYAAGDYRRYVEYHYRKTRRIHRITQVENSEYLQKILALAQRSALFTALASSLADDEITMEEATEFIHELIDAQVLVSELEPAVTNVRPLATLITTLNGLSNKDGQIAVILSEVENQLVAIDRQPIGDTADIYPAIIKNIEKIKVEAEIKYLFQADLFKPAQHATIGRSILKDIQQTLTFLNKITPPAGRTNLSQFRENFVKRYDDREMPLLFVLDTELGVGYAGNTSGDISPLVDDLTIPQGPSLPNSSQSSVQSILLQKYQQSLQKVIELTDEDVKDIEAVWDDLPDTMSVICEILQDNDLGRSVYIKSAGGQSAANLLGRFCHLNEQILNHTLAITAKETLMNSGAIFAEIVHLPESRTGNILLRPVLRPYEIPYLAKPGVSGEFELKTDDLYVSVKSNRIVLRSKHLNKEIIPRMSTAHNYSGQSPMPVYHFLCDMQHQTGRSGLGFHWNEAAQQMSYLPRVVYKNCILAQARWTIREMETKIFAGIKDDNELVSKVKEWLDRRNIPDKVLLADGDNELYIDMKHPSSIRAWLSVVKKRHFFQLEELLFDPATAVVYGPEGVFTNEFIFAFFREPVAKKA